MIGFKHWFQGLQMILMFLSVIAIPCFFIALWGSKMINELGNHPTRSVEIQASASWKILVVEAFSFLFLICLYMFLYNIQS